MTRKNLGFRKIFDERRLQFWKYVAGVKRGEGSTKKPAKATLRGEKSKFWGGRDVAQFDLSIHSKSG